MVYFSLVRLIGVALCLFMADGVTAQTVAPMRPDAGHRNAAPTARYTIPLLISDGWRTGKPDLIVRMSRPFMVPAAGPDFTRCFVVPLNLPADTWVSEVEFQPQTPQIVRHVQILAESTHSARMLQAETSGVGFASIAEARPLLNGPFSDWQPGSLPTFSTPGVARHVTPGADLVLMIHFHPDGKPESEQSSVGLYFSKGPPARQFAVVPLDVNRSFVRSGLKDYQIGATFTLPVDVEAVGIVLHARPHCNGIRSFAVLPHGTLSPLLQLDAWDYDRPDSYRYAHPITLPAGTRISAEFTYDNTADSPGHPSNLAQLVTWSTPELDEMAGLWLQVVLKRPSDREALVRAVSSAQKFDQVALARAAYRDYSPHVGATEAPVPVAGYNVNLQGKYRFRLWQALHPFDGNHSPHPDLGERRSSEAPPSVGATNGEDREYTPR